MRIFALSLILLTFLVGQSQTLVINLTNVRNTEGQIQVAIFENDDQIKNEEPVSKLYFDKKAVRDGKLTLRIPMAAGTYGISVLDDEDKSTDMTFKMGVYPKECVGFSNYVLKGMSKPKFEEFDFVIKDGQSTTVEVYIKYF